jgi:sulfate adenylyltransferase subunit 1
MDVLRIATAGSVDDGKSTLIGRLLYETNSITSDRLEAIERASQRKGIDFLDLSLLTDGLIAEREQGITIDVAHIYFNTPKRKFIIADSPGHVEYTRNMITGASKADVSIILIDARNGIVEQTHRHFFIANLLRIPNVIVCINKMDLVDYSQDRFESIKRGFLSLAEKLPNKNQEIAIIPISSLYGDNLTATSGNMNWYTGSSLLDTLENLPVRRNLSQKPFRLPIQYVIRPRNEANHDFRGYAGKVASGEIKEGDEVMTLPSGRKSRVDKIYQYDKTLSKAEARQSVTITLENDIDISRGDLLVKTAEQPVPLSEFPSYVCWLNNQPMSLGKTYLLQHGTQLTKAKVVNIDFIQDPASMLKIESAVSLKMNDIAQVRVKTAKPLGADRYEDNESNGSFILIDEHSNNTVAVGFIN